MMVRLFLRARSLTLSFLLAVPALLTVASQSAAETQLLSATQTWQVLRQSQDGGDTLCLVRAVHPGIVEREVLWVIDGGELARYPEGYLRVSRAVEDVSATSISVAIDGVEIAHLTTGLDGSFYSKAEETARLRAAFAEGLSMTFTPSTDTGRALTISLVGSRSALGRAGAGCR